MSTDVIVSFVTFSSQELTLRLNQRWSFLSIEKGQVCMFGEPIADFDKRGGSVRLQPLGPRELARWAAWALQDICPDAEANDEEADPSRIVDEPMTVEEVERMARGIDAARRAAIAKEADPSGGGHQAVALVLYLVKRELLELTGSTAAVAGALVPLLQDVDDKIGTKLEDALLDLDDVDELFADADELGKIVQENRHLLDD